MELGFSGTNVFLNLHILDTHSVAGDSLSVSSDRGSIHGRRFDKPQRRHFLEQVSPRSPSSCSMAHIGFECTYPTPFLAHLLFTFPLQQVNVLKNKLHLNSFVYDFHVHQFSEIVCGRTELRPSFPIVDVLEAFGGSWRTSHTRSLYAGSCVRSHRSGMQ